MGTRLIFLDPVVVTNVKSCLLLSDWGGGGIVPGNSSTVRTVPETDTGGQVENTKALEGTVLKELGKIPP